VAGAERLRRDPPRLEDDVAEVVERPLARGDPALPLIPNAKPEKTPIPAACRRATDRA
jgi:hypothetical protein